MPYRFLFDEHVSYPACTALRDRGVDVTHVLDVGLSRASDADVLARAAAEGRIVVTRNYRDFAKLVEAYNAGDKPFPGVLFLPVSLSQADVGAHAEAVAGWIAAQGSKPNPVENAFGWLRAP